MLETTFTRNGYAAVIGDVRGTGASFGIWPYHRARAETLDLGEVITWIGKQTWSNGSVAGYGVSYRSRHYDLRIGPPIVVRGARYVRLA